MKRQNRFIIGTVLGLLTFCGFAAESDNIVVFEDSFDRSELGDPWIIKVPAFSIKDGRLVAEQERAHTTISRILLDFRNAAFEYSFRLTDGDDLHLVINDQNCEEAHSGHICRVTISATGVRISDDRNGAFRKDQYQAFLASGRTIKRDLYETTISVSLDSEKWYKARVNIIDDRVEVLIDGKSIGTFNSTGIAHPTKTDFGFVTKGNLVEIDDVRVTKIGNE